MTNRGYFGIGVFHGKSSVNIGTLCRSAYQCGAAFVFTVGARYERQRGDTVKSWLHMPLLHYRDIHDLIEHLPYSCPLIAIEMGGTPLRVASHPERCCYLLGAEDHGLPEEVASLCHGRISLESVRTNSFNVAVAGSLVMYDRCEKRNEFINNPLGVAV